MMEYPARRVSALVLCCLVVATATTALAAAPFEPPENYYGSATGTGELLRNQLHAIIDDQSTFSYGDLRTILQHTDQDLADPDHIILVYDRRSLDTSNLSASGIPGWDPIEWNREHTWPRSRGVDSSGPDNTDLHHLRPSTTSVNSSRGNLNFGGQFGQEFGRVEDNGSTVWYPGDADAGMIARQMFYMDVRYDGQEPYTEDLELMAGDPGSSQGLGDLDRLLEWHFLAPPDEFEQRRNHVIYDQYQANRNPFVDRPEAVWSIFVDQANDSQITLAGAQQDEAGASSLAVAYDPVLMGAPIPASQVVEIDKAGNDGTYFAVSTTGIAQSSLTDRWNAFRTGGEDSAAIEVGLDTQTDSAGLQTGTITIDNLDITTGGGSGRGGHDGDDLIQLELPVLDHALPSFDDESIMASLELDFGTITLGSSPASLDFAVHNLVATPGYTASMELDGVSSSGDTTAFTTNLTSLDGDNAIVAGQGAEFMAMLDSAEPGDFAATYELLLSDEDLPGELTQSLTLELTGQVIAPALEGDFNSDGVVNAADYVVWRNNLGGGFTPEDYDTWKANFGMVLPGGAAAAGVPEPAGLALAWCVGMLLMRRGSLSKLCAGG